MAGAQRPPLISTPKVLLECWGWGWGRGCLYLMRKLQTETRKTALCVSADIRPHSFLCFWGQHAVFLSGFFHCCLQREGTEINPMTPRQPVQMTGQMWGYRSAYRPVFSLSSRLWWDRHVERNPRKCKAHRSWIRSPAVTALKKTRWDPENARPHHCATCPLRDTCETGSTGTCCGSSSGFCSCFRTCRTPAWAGWFSGRNPGGQKSESGNTKLQSNPRREMYFRPKKPD